jgi:hypothetical protein
MSAESLEQRYGDVKEKWEKANWVMSSGRTNLPEFHQIVELGTDVIPIILKDLMIERSWIVSALFYITSERPSKEMQPGRLSSVVEAWLEWGVEKGYIDRAD